MLRKVTLERYREFREIDIPLGEVTGIIGPNSSGKTTVLRAIRLACESVSFVLDELGVVPKARATTISVCQERRTIVPDPSRLAALADWRALFLNAEVGDGTRARINLEFAPTDPVQELELRLVHGRNAQLKIGLDIASRAVSAEIRKVPGKSKFRPKRLREAIDRVRPRATFVPAFYGVARTEEYRTMPLVRRHLGSGDQSHIVRNLLARMDQGAIDRMNGFLARALRSRVVDRIPATDAEQRSDLSASFRDDSNGPLELSAGGAGLIALIAVYSAMTATRDELSGSVDPRPTALFLLDEPEAHLHPRLQGHVGEELARVAREFGYQLVLATHSVEMINRLGRRDDAVLVHVDRTTDRAEVLGSENDVTSALDTFCDLAARGQSPHATSLGPSAAGVVGETRSTPGTA